MRIVTDIDEILQNAHECVLNAKAAVNGYIENHNVQVSIQFMNQAFICAKQVQGKYYGIINQPIGCELEQFDHQFILMKKIT